MVSSERLECIHADTPMHKTVNCHINLINLIETLMDTAIIIQEGQEDMKSIERTPPPSPEKNKKWEAHGPHHSPEQQQFLAMNKLEQNYHYTSNLIQVLN